MTDTANLRNRAHFDFFKSENIRFSDTDMVGHVNNVAFAALVETGRTYFTERAAFPRHGDAYQLVTARLEIDYLAELHWPGSVDIGTCVLTLGRSSFAIGNGVFNAERCVATSRSVLVLIDRATRKPAALPQDYRAALQALII